jgi:pimeloyl-ACP methyl ester carboxylesterase
MRSFPRRVIIAILIVVLGSAALRLVAIAYRLPWLIHDSLVYAPTWLYVTVGAAVLVVAIRRRWTPRWLSLIAATSGYHWLWRTWRGVQSALAGYAFILGGWWLGRSWRKHEEGRLENGLILVLPGIEGAGPLNWSIARGIVDAGDGAAVRVIDWTTGFWPFFCFHLRAARRNRVCASRIATMIADYQDLYPGRPVYLVGHSGGAALAVWALEALPESRTITAAVLLGVALSPRYSLAAALGRTQCGIWNFFSPLDWIFLTIGTILFGTFDGRHVVSAGWRGFALPPELDAGDRALYQNRLHQRGYHPRMLGYFHPGGHLGWANRVFVSEVVAPLVGSTGA